MNVEVIYAKLTYAKEGGYVGALHLNVEGHAAQYEMSLQSNKGRDWGYSLFYLNGFGNEDQMLALEDEIEENDELFFTLIAKAKEVLEEKEVSEEKE